MSDFICVLLSQSRQKAEIAQCFLAQNGIRAFVLGDDAGGMSPHLSLGGSMRLMVCSEDVGKASDLLRQMEAGNINTDEKPEWKKELEEEELLRKAKHEKSYLMSGIIPAFIGVCSLLFFNDRKAGTTFFGIFLLIALGMFLQWRESVKVKERVRSQEN